VLEHGNASSHLSCGGWFGAARAAVRCGNNAGTQFAADSHQQPRRSAKPWHPDSINPGAIRNLTTAPAPAPDMASDLVRAAMPKAQSASEDDLAKVKPAARAARAEAPPTKKRVTRTQPPVEHRQNNTGSYREFGLSGY
jgi:hypothetical protein